MRPDIYSTKDHPIQKSKLDADALKIVHTLQQAGFIAYLVGGCVRDLLSGKSPKDFDISTSAKPEEIKRLFKRNCLLIGKRFRLAHIRYGRKIFEVSTFRAGINLHASKLIVRDNEWGTPEQDVLRRDFTMNGLFFDPITCQLIDYVGGAKDIQKHLLRTIGDPKTRFIQDPVRMVRLLKFRARFGFHVDPPTMHALLSCREDILNSAPARLLEEILRMLESGAAHSFFTLMKEVKLWQFLFPNLNLSKHAFALLKAADATHQNSFRPIDRAVLFCCFLYPELEATINKREVPSHMGHILTLTYDIFYANLKDTFVKLPKRLVALIKFTLGTQYRLTALETTKNFRRSRLLRSPDFPLALGLLRLRSKVDPSLRKTYEKWKTLHKEAIQAPQLERHHHTRQHAHKQLATEERPAEAE